MTATDFSTRDARIAYLRDHAGGVYDAVTEGRTKFVRVAELVYRAAERFPGLAPSRAEIAAEAGLLQRDKKGLEIDQGILLSHILADERAGTHLCHAMLLPRPESREMLERFGREGVLDLGAAALTRRGRAVHVEMRNPRYLNAEDQATIDAVEIAIDVATLDPNSDIAVLRGGSLDHPKYRGRRSFGAGINLTH